MPGAGRPLLLVLASVILLLSLAAYLTTHFSGRLDADRQSVLRAFEVIDTARELLSLAQDAETGQRGFIITQRASYLEPYRSSVAMIDSRLATLSKLTADDGQQARRVTELQSAVDAKLDELRVTLDLNGRGQSSEAQAVIMSDQGKVAMDGIRRIVGEIVAAEQARLSDRVGATSDTERYTLYAAMLGSTLALAALMLGTFLLQRSNRSLRRAEARLSQQGMVLQATLDNCRDGIAAVDATGGLAAFNRHFFKLLDLPPEYARTGVAFAALQEFDRGRPGRGLADPDPAGADAAETFVEARVGATDLEIYRNRTPDGGFVVSALDVTRRRQSEAIIRQAVKMEAIGRLAGGIAHDFNNLLQVIGSNLDLLAGELPPDGDVARRLGNAVSATERGARLTGQLLAFARRQPLDPRVLDLGRVVGEMGELLQRTLGEHIAVETVTGAGLWNTLVDPSQVENALLNLAINARDAMAEHGGKLTIEVANTSLDHAYAAAHEEVVAGQYVMLAVSDTGTGMSPEVAARVFEPFFTTKPEGQGTGLGLSQVYGFVKQSSGHIKIYSEPGHGTTVKLYLPRTRRPADVPEVARTAPVQGGNETILVVEDDAPVRLAVIELLGDLGYSVLAAGGAEAALAILASGAAVDLLFTDVVMPGPISTRELVRRAQRKKPGLAVLYTSGYTENAIIHDGRLDRDVLLLSKPYRHDELARRVRMALAQARDRGGPEHAAVAGRYTVLVVEDDELVRMATVDMLRQLGHEVAEAGTGYDALDALRRRTDIDVLITDLGLPGMSGQELVAAARALRPKLQILLATGYSVADVEQDVVLLAKPFMPEDLRRALTSLDLDKSGRMASEPP